MADNARSLRAEKQAGQSLVEFALVLLFVILPFMFVLVDGAVTLYTYVMVTNAAREGARAGSIYQVTTAPDFNQTFDQQVAAIDALRASYVQTQTRLLLGTLVSFPQCSTVVTYTPAIPIVNGVPNPYRELDTIRLDLACPRRLFFGLITTRQITLSATSSMRIEPGGVAPSSP